MLKNSNKQSKSVAKQVNVSGADCHINLFQIRIISAAKTIFFVQRTLSLLPKNLWLRFSLSCMQISQQTSYQTVVVDLSQFWTSGKWVGPLWSVQRYDYSVPMLFLLQNFKLDLNVYLVPIQLPSSSTDRLFTVSLSWAANYT